MYLAIMRSKSRSHLHVPGLLVACFLICSCGQGPDSSRSLTQPQLGARTVEILEADGLKFKDLNRNGLLDVYEDWRVDDEERSRYLVGKMSLEQKAGFMLISSTRLENDWSFERGKNTGEIGSGFNEDDLVSTINIFTRKPLAYPMMSAAGTTKAVTQYQERHFIVRANPSVRILAEWANKLQALCESDGLGIPAIITSNPRNHITDNAALGLSVGESSFSRWPGELGLAAMRDLELTRTFANVARQEWVATGIRKGYMYMADLATEPRWQRTNGTFGEDAQLAGKMIREVVLGFQGESLGNNSVALTTKHFPGGGSAEGGQDPHFDWGKREVFPGGMFENNLIPFQAAIDAGTSSIMPYYSFPVGTKYDELGYAYNKGVLQDLLRKEMGFDGIINSDTGPIEMMPWGVEELNLVQRYKLAIEAGINIFSGSADPTKLIETLKAHPGLMQQVDASVYLLLLEKFKLGLFENPYVDVDAAERIVGKQEFQDQADLALRKSIVLLRNGRSNSHSLPLAAGTKVYFTSHQMGVAGAVNNVISLPGITTKVQLVDTPEEADVVLLWLLPKTKSLFASDGSPLHVSLSKNGIDITYVNKLIDQKPTILAINFTNPWAIDEIYGDNKVNVDAVLATFGTTPEALLDIVTGVHLPSGKMPFSTPVSDAAAQSQKSDVPGYQEGTSYALFHFDEGLSY